MMPRGLYQVIYGWRYPTVRDCGDAVLTDVGPGAAGDRYVADFGYLAFGAETETTFKLCALPREWMALGLDVELPGKDRLDVEVNQFKEGTLHDVKVAVSLADQNGRTVLTHEGALGESWVWSYGSALNSAFVYNQYTMFIPRRGQTYELRVSVVPADRSTDARARLVVNGGGWKAASPPSDGDVETVRDLIK